MSMRTYTRPFTIARLLLGLALVLGFVMFAPTATHAATRNVCPSGCTYSQIQPAINAASNGDTINIGEGTYYGGLDIFTNVTLAGAGAGLTTIQGVHLGYPDITDGRAVLIDLGATVRIQGVTITTDYPDSGDPRNGGILNFGTLTVANSAIDKNRAPFGGGIANQGGTLTVINSVISRNFADSVGGGILNYENSTATIINSTISGNYNLGSMAAASPTAAR
jgi:hypothetical protein